MSTYCNRLQPALQNLLQRVVRFFHPRSSCPTHISVDVCGGRKSFVKPVMRQNISSCFILSPEIVMHDDAYIGGRSENNIKCVVHDDLRWKNRITQYWLYEWFSQFHRCGSYSVLSRSPSIIQQRHSFHFGPVSRSPWVSRYQNDKPLWMLLQSETMMEVLVTTVTMKTCKAAVRPSLRAFPHSGLMPFLI